MSTPATAFRIGANERALVLLYRGLTRKQKRNLIGWAAWQRQHPAKSQIATGGAR